MALCAVGILSAGCYSLQPVAGPAPQSGTRVALDITDAGRVALGGSMGPEIVQVSGTLLSGDTSEYVLSVSDVKYLRGDMQAWKGETVRIRPSYVSRMYLREFSRTRTAVVAAVGVALVVGAVSGKLGPIHLSPDPDPGDGGEALKRPRRPLGITTPVPRFIPPRSY
jgi:hypothetical protein